MANEIPVQFGGTGASTANEAIDNLGTPAPNKIKTPQLVVVGTNENALPSPTPTSYAINEQVALGWVASTAVTNLVTDANGNVKLQTPATDTGVIYYDIDLADNNTPVLATLFGSVMRCTNAATGTYTQLFAEDTAGITVTNPTASTARITIDLTVLTDGFKVAGLSDFRGRLELLSTEDIIVGIGGIGVNQPLKNVTSSRTPGVSRTNSTGRTIWVSVNANQSSASGTLSLIINGGTVQFTATAGSNDDLCVSGPVGDGQLYQVNTFNSGVSSWWEYTDEI